jgi:hypothetical protein
MTSEKIIDELLHEAEDLKIRDEVLNLTKKIMDLNPRMERIDALELALKHIKNPN